MSAPKEDTKPAQKTKGEKKPEMSDEDIKKKADIELLVERVQDADEGLQLEALKLLCKEIRTSTSSMTSVPKPLKFLRPHFDTLKNYFATTTSSNKKLFSDLLSVMSMTIGSTERDVLKYKLSGTEEDITTWGHEYLRHLGGEIAEEYNARVKADNDNTADLLALVDKIVPYNVSHNSEPEACDLLMEVESLDRVIPLVTEHNFKRICLYLSSCANYVNEPEDAEILTVVMKIYIKMNQFPSALVVAIKLADHATIQDIFYKCRDNTPLKRQLGFMLARNQMFDLLENLDDDSDPHFAGIVRNNDLSKYFRALQEDLQVTDPKHPDDIYKNHLTESRTTQKIDSAHQNLASSFVNAFVNAGSGTDLLMTQDPKPEWLSKNKEQGILCATASIGLINAWDVDKSNLIDAFASSDNTWIKSGALLAHGILTTGVRSQFDATFSLLEEHLSDTDSNVKNCSALSLGIAYAGSNREDVKESLVQVFRGASSGLIMETLGLTAISIGLVAVGTCDPELTQMFLEIYDNAENLNSPYLRLIAVGLGLLYLGKKDASDLTVEILNTAGPMGQYAAVTVMSMAYANSGNVLKIQHMLHQTAEHLEKDNEYQSAAVLGIAIMAAAEDIGSEMVLRTFDHLLQYGELNVKRAVPLALALNCIGNPDMNVTDMLSKLSHDHDEEVAIGAIFSLGVVGVGTNNSKIAQLLRNLAAYYAKDRNHLFMVRIAQGLLHMGKGTISIKPIHTQQSLVSWAAQGAIIALFHACLDMPGLILDKVPHLLYLLSVAMYPRLVMLLETQEDGSLQPKPVNIRVGQAMDVVGQAGKPKTITGFQTHASPVLLGHNERAEMATDVYLPLTDILDGFVIVQRNPDAKEKDMLRSSGFIAK